MDESCHCAAPRRLSLCLLTHSLIRRHKLSSKVNVVLGGMNHSEIRFLSATDFLLQNNNGSEEAQQKIQRKRNENIEFTLKQTQQKALNT